MPHCWHSLDFYASHGSILALRHPAPTHEVMIHNGLDVLVDGLPSPLGLLSPPTVIAWTMSTSQNQQVAMLCPPP